MEKYTRIIENDERFAQYTNLLLEWNEKFNLTRITAPEEIKTKHYLDSLSLLSEGCIVPGMRVADVGSGAGFPGIPLKLADDSLNVTLFDGTNKRVQFMNEVIRQLRLTNIEALHLRGEEAGRNPRYTSSYDAVVCRAVASLDMLASYCLPLVKHGGVLLCMKGKEISEEIFLAGAKLRKYKSVCEKTILYTIPGTDVTHSIVVIRKKV